MVCRPIRRAEKTLAKAESVVDVVVAVAAAVGRSKAVFCRDETRWDILSSLAERSQIPGRCLAAVAAAAADVNAAAGDTSRTWRALKDCGRRVLLPGGDDLQQRQRQRL